MNTPSNTDRAVILFDGVCNLCNGAVNFIIDRDPAGYFCFGALQSEEARALLHRYGQPSDVVQSVVLIEGGRVYLESTAALRIVRRLERPWSLLYPLIAVPRPLRDAAYAWISRNRYHWFGRREVCRTPTPDLEERFLSPTLTSVPAAVRSTV